jgi:hypothetical protein
MEWLKHNDVIGDELAARRTSRVIAADGELIYQRTTNSYRQPSLVPVSWAGVVLNSGVVGPSLVEVGLGGGREWPVEKPNPGGRKKTLRDTTRTAEISEST